MSHILQHRHKDSSDRHALRLLGMAHELHKQGFHRDHGQRQIPNGVLHSRHHGEPGDPENRERTAAAGGSCE